MESANDITGFVGGAQAVLDWFGRWPSFHDGEIIELHLSRRGPSRLKLHTWRIAKKLVDGKAHFSTEQEAVVTFVLERVTDLKLEEFGHQNVIYALRLEQRESGVRLVLEPCYGISGYIEAATVSVEMVPGGPGDD
jgi:Immunity protein 50